MADMNMVQEIAKAADYLAVIATTRTDGSVHASLVKAGLLDDPENGKPSVGIVVAGQARKLAHLRRSGRATVLFQAGWRWVAVEGPVSLIGPEDPPPNGAERDVLGVIRAVYVAAGGTHDDWAEFDRVMTDDRRCAVFVEARSVTSNG